MDHHALWVSSQVGHAWGERVAISCWEVLQACFGGRKRGAGHMSSDVQVYKAVLRENGKEVAIKVGGIACLQADPNP